MIEIRIDSSKWLKYFSSRCSKVKYGHKETAEKAAIHMHTKTGDSYDSYYCMKCESWHIGHSHAD